MSPTLEPPNHRAPQTNQREADGARQPPKMNMHRFSFWFPFKKEKKLGGALTKRRATSQKRRAIWLPFKQKTTTRGLLQRKTSDPPKKAEPPVDVSLKNASLPGGYRHGALGDAGGLGDLRALEISGRLGRDRTALPGGGGGVLLY